MQHRRFHQYGVLANSRLPRVLAIPITWFGQFTIDGSLCMLKPTTEAYLVDLIISTADAHEDLGCRMQLD